MRLIQPAKDRLHASPIRLPMTGMIDVVFLLLIFFLTTTSFQPPAQSVVTPVITDDDASSPLSSTEPPLMLTVYPKGQGGNGQGVQYQLAGVRTNDEGEICELLKQIRPTGEPILVKISGGLTFQSAMSAFELCKSCGHPSAVWYCSDEK